jgi:hypothetical protein
MKTDCAEGTIFVKKGIFVMMKRDGKNREKEKTSD